ncbi:YSIRK-type signal peptide-containing protein, partial [Streptococcus halichoeri]
MFKSKQIFSLRKLKLGVASVLLATSFLIASGNVSAQQICTQDNSALQDKGPYEPPYGGALGTGYENRENPYDISTYVNQEDPYSSNTDEDKGPYEPPYGGALGTGYENRENPNKDNQETHEDSLKEAYLNGFQDGLSGQPPRVFEGFDKDDDIKASYDKGYQDGIQEYQDGLQDSLTNRENQEAHERQVNKAHETGYQDGLAGRPPRIFEGFDKDDDIKASYDKGYQDGYQ